MVDLATKTLSHKIELCAFVSWWLRKVLASSLRSARINPGGAFLPAFDPARPELSY